MYSRDYLDDYDPSSTYSDAFSTTGRTAAERRKNDWKHANKRKKILADNLSKPLHYYSKNMPASYAIDRRQERQTLRQIDNFQNQLKELLDEE